MNLSNNKLFAALAAVTLSVLLGVFGYFITRPYIQYEEGSFYKSGNTSIVSLRLENKGYFDAEQVIVETIFPEIISEITSGDAVSPFSVTSGGKGFKNCVGLVPRIVPSQAVYVYFAVDNTSGGVADSPGFVRQVTFKNGQGSANPPMWRNVTYGLFIGLLTGLLSTLTTYAYTKYKAQTERANHLDSILSRWEASAKERMDEWEREKPEREKLLAELEAQVKEVRLQAADANRQLQEARQD
jgi:hypothetical protein